MKINFNGLRRQMANSYNSLVRILNTDMEGCTITTEHDSIEEDINNLRSQIGALLCIYDEKDEDFDDLSNDVKLIQLHDSYGNMEDPDGETSID